MNYALFNSPFFTLNIITILVLLFPLLSLVVKRNCWKPHFLPLASIFTVFLIAALLNNRIPDLGEPTARLSSTAGLMFLSPLALYFLLFFLNGTPKGEEMKRAIKYSLVFYLFSCMGIFLLRGLDEISGALSIGLGFVLVLAFGMPIFIRQIRDSVHKRIDTGKAFMIAGIIFSFACYGLIFLMYFVFRSGMRHGELFLLFQLTTILFALLATAGILMFRPTPLPPTVEKKSDRLPLLTEWEEFTQR